MNERRRSEVVDDAAASDFATATVAVLAEYRGLTVAQLDRLRTAVREADGALPGQRRTRSRGARSTETRYAKLDAACCAGPTALDHRLQDPVAIAKVAGRSSPSELPKLEIKGAVLDGAAAAGRRGEGARRAAVARGRCWRSCSACCRRRLAAAAHPQRARGARSRGSSMRIGKRAERRRRPQQSSNTEPVRL